MELIFENNYDLDEIMNTNNSEEFMDNFDESNIINHNTNKEEMDDDETNEENNKMNDDEEINNNEESEETEVIGISRYKNIGNTCYMNSILHILQQIPLFLEYITFAKFKNSINNDLKSNVIYELFRLFKTSAENDDIVITPTSFKKLIGKKNDRWDDNKQQDSQEFFNFLISQIEEEVGTKCKFIPGGEIHDKLLLNYSFDNILASNSWMKFQAKEFSPLKNMFDGLTKISKQCAYCNNSNSIFEPFISLGLEIKDNLYDCFDNLIFPEELDAKNKVRCDFCGIKNKSKSNILLWKTPDILVIHFKRFIANSSRKNNSNIDYPTNLDLSKYMDPASPQKNKIYDLIGINIHQGFTINSGHYTSYVKNIINKKWYHYNDSQQITKVRNIQNQNAYMLFYEKK
jgi:ubiquitin carboxyl-terminal hydrolase 8